jgi:glycosyltransferase involved in cell wall biosynthesis
MKIAVNCIFFGPKGNGIKEYIGNFLTSLSAIDTNNEYLLYVLSDRVEYAREHLPVNMRIKPVPYSSHQTLKRSLFLNRFFRKEEKIENFDLFHSPFFHSPVFKKAKVVMTVHDLRLYRYPSTYSFLRYWFLRFEVKRSVQTCQHIISISEFTKKELIELIKIDENKITVIHEAVNENQFSKIQITDFQSPIKALQNTRFLLTVGHIEPRKNYERLLIAFEQLKRKTYHSDIKLIIVGNKSHSYKKVMNRISKMEDVYYLNFVDHDFLLWLYSNASLFVYPSIYEGFGFPPLEAACFGTVSAVSNISSIPEICGDSVFYFNPFDIKDIESVLNDSLVNPDKINDKKALLFANLRKFSWKRNAEESLKVYAKVFSVMV